MNSNSSNSFDSSVPEEGCGDPDCGGCKLDKKLQKMRDLMRKNPEDRPDFPGLSDPEIKQILEGVYGVSVERLAAFSLLLFDRTSDLLRAYISASESGDTKGVVQSVQDKLRNAANLGLLFAFEPAETISEVLNSQSSKDSCFEAAEIAFQAVREIPQTLLSEAYKKLKEEGDENLIKSEIVGFFSPVDRKNHIQEMIEKLLGGRASVRVIQI